MALDPPSVVRDDAVAAALDAAYDAKGPDYVPRTHLKDAAGRARYVNSLILEASPYLLQHAHNPVDWHPWSEATLAKAATLDRPIFLSVGYATCHWCHVMEEESFDNEEVAAVLNAHFIAVKIDREQRPDLDQVFITATQLQQGHAGWPNSVFLTPDGRPFHTGTYFPRPQFLQLLRAIAGAWEAGKRREIEGVAGQLSAALARFAPQGSSPAVALDDTVMSRAAGAIVQMHNEFEGGFSNAQQFPQEVFLLFLLDHWRYTGDRVARDAALATLDAIAAGGIHDHVGGGFHRYTVDPNWRTPHFEKMLYNQGLLARAFTEAWEITGRPAYRRAAERAFTYVLRDMTDPEGAFHAAEDADSLDALGALEEGAFYVWPAEDAGRALGADAGAAISLLGLEAAPTIEAGPVAHLDPQSDVDFAVLDPLLERLRLARDDRIRPLRDEKIIAGWNGLMVRALADGAVAFSCPELAVAAARAGDTLWSRLWRDGALHRLWAGGGACEQGTLEDYAWLGLGYLALWDATGEERWRARAETLAKAALERFRGAHGRLKMAAADGPVGPIYDSADGATPAGESSAAELFARLAHRSGDPRYRAAAEALLAALSEALAAQPLLRPDALAASRLLATGGSGSRRRLAGGALGLRMAAGGTSITLDLAEGWHLNAHDPGADWLVGAAVDGAGVDWPDGVPMQLGFSQDQIRVYEGRLALEISAAEDEIAFALQLCSDRLCLEPISAIFRLR